MGSGYKFNQAMKESRIGVEEFRLREGDLNIESDTKFTYKMDLLQAKLLEESQIKPHSLFGISNQTFIDTLVSILGYLVILIRFRTVEGIAFCDMYNQTTV